MRCFSLIGLAYTLLGCSLESKHEYSFPPMANYVKIPDSIRNFSEDDKKMAILGRALFYDPIVSLDSTLSCASCHLQSSAFGDNLKVSRGYHGRAVGVRNTPPLFNLFVRNSFFRDGGIPRLEQVALAPMQSPKELHQPLEDLVRRLEKDKKWVDRFKKLASREITPYSVTRALASYQRSLVSLNSPYDKYMDGDDSAINESAKRGLQLFFSKAKCYSCHSGPFFSDDQFRHIGLFSEGVDSGRAQIAYKWSEFGKFRTPTLRNLVFTSPYMHDGSFETLHQIIRYYNEGGSDHSLKDTLIEPLGLSSAEQEDLVSFLQALSDSTFIHWKDFSYHRYDYSD